ncbi:MAG: RNA methyltransferase [Acidimicrobiia bacterium]
MTISVLTKSDVLNLKELARSSKSRYEFSKAVVEGRRAIDGALRCGAILEQLLLVKGSDVNLDIDESKIVYIDEKSLEKISTTQKPQNVIGIFQIPKFDQNIKGKIFVLDHVSDPGNIGTIIRSALAFGIDAIVAIGGCDFYNTKVIRSSAGNVFGIPTFALTEIEAEQLLSKFEIYVTDLQANEEISDIKFKQNAAIVLGNEANGIISEIFAKNTRKFKIPMQELSESLNVAMTATIIAYKLAEPKEKNAS